MLDEAWALSPSVALRPEPFGALAYDFHTRRLTFLKTPALVDVVRRLEAEPTVADALRRAGVQAGDHPAYAAALRTLAGSGVVVRRPAPAPPAALRDPEPTPTR